MATGRVQGILRDAGGWALTRERNALPVLRRLLSGSEATLPPEEEGRASLLAGSLSLDTDDWDTAEAYLARSVRAFTDIGSDAGVAEASLRLADLAWARGQGESYRRQIRQIAPLAEAQAKGAVHGMWLLREARWSIATANLEQAGELLEEAATKGGGPTRGVLRGERSLLLSDLALWKGNYKQAARDAAAALRAGERVPSPLLRARALVRLARSRFPSEGPSVALAELNEAIQTFRRLRCHRGLILALAERADLERLAGTTRHAVSGAIAALERAQGLGYVLGEARARLALGLAHYALDEYESARSSTEGAGDLFEQIPHKLWSLAAASARIQVLQVAVPFGEWIGPAQQLVRRTRRVGCRGLEAEVHRHVGEGYRIVDRPTRAIHHQDAALALYREMRSSYGAGLVLSDKGDLALDSDELEAAGEILSAALVEFTRCGFRMGQAWVLDSRADYFTRLDRYEDAERDALASLRIARALRDDYDVANAHRTLGHLHLRTEQVSQAAKDFSSALAIFQRVGEQMAVSNVLLELANVRRMQGELEEAASLLDRAVPLLRAEGDRAGEARANIALSSIGRLRHDLPAAEDQAARALSIARRLRAPTTLAEAYMEAGRVSRLSGGNPPTRSFVRARELFARSGNLRGEAEARSELAIELQARGKIRDIRDIRAGLAEALKAVDALERVRESLGAGASRVRHYRRYRRTYLLALDLAEQAGDGHAAARVMEAARASGLAALLRRGPVDLPGPLGDALRRVAEAEASSARPDEPPPGSPHRAAEVRHGRRLHRAYADLERVTSSVFLSAFGPSFAGGLTSEMSLPTEAHALMYEMLLDDDGASAVWTVWIRPNGDVSVSSSPIESELAPWIRRWARRDGRLIWHGATLDPESSRGGHLADLGRLLLPAELRDELLRRDAPLDLVLVPSGGLWAVPFAALLVGSRRLVELANLAYAPSLGVIEALLHRSSGPGHGSVGYFNRSLEGTEAERLILSRRFPRLRRLREHSLIRDLADADGYTVAALSTHGDDRPGLAHGLLLADGSVLTAGQMLGARFPRLVVLGACSSGALELVPGGEPLGLPTVCLARGASSVIGAIFPVEAKPAGDVLSRTYNHLADGLSPSRALRRAQIEHAAFEEGCTPAHWPGMVVIGLP